MLSGKVPRGDWSSFFQKPPEVCLIVYSTCVAYNCLILLFKVAYIHDLRSYDLSRISPEQVFPLKLYFALHNIHQL